MAIAFSDTDPMRYVLDGKVVITKAADESDVTSYALYWGTSATTKLYLTPIVTLPANGTNPTYEFIHQGRPQLATHLLAFSVNGAGMMATGVATPISEIGQSVCTKTYAGQPGGSGDYPSAVIDTANSKLLVVTQNNANFFKPALFRCDLDGTGCTYSDISAGQGTNTGYTASAVIDSAGGKLLAVTRNGANSNKPALFRCNLDGSACTYTDISTGQAAGSGWVPSAVIDAANAKLLVVTQSNANSGKPALFRCDLDGSACTYSDISAGQGANSGADLSAVIDTANSKLLVVTQNTANSNKPALFRCDLDGSACTYSDISAGQGADSGTTPSAVIDAANGKLLVISRNGANSSKLALFRCDLDGSACTHTDISAGQGANSGYLPSAVIDPANGKLLVVTMNWALNVQSLFRCDLDGSACTHTDISTGQTCTGQEISAVIDAANTNLFVATQMGLFNIGLR